jgi:hypothetical protein
VQGDVVAASTEYTCSVAINGKDLGFDMFGLTGNDSYRFGIPIGPPVCNHLWHHSFWLRNKDHDYTSKWFPRGTVDIHFMHLFQHQMKLNVLVHSMCHANFAGNEHYAISYGIFKERINQRHYYPSHMCKRGRLQK